MTRLLNIIAAFICCVILAPFMGIIALLIKLTSKGTVIFKQRRIGLGGKEFNMYKFRTMYTDTPDNVPTHLLDDPLRHITRFGGFLRKVSLDELPQLWNILSGDMNFVGPRPALYNQYDLIELREKYNIHSIRPGITGWAQVNGRDELIIPLKVEYDKYYLENRSLGLDLRIIALTVSRVLSGKGIIEGKQ